MIFFGQVGQADALNVSNHQSFRTGLNRRIFYEEEHFAAQSVQKADIFSPMTVEKLALVTVMDVPKKICSLLSF